jgi:hypothetical protein
VLEGICLIRTIRLFVPFAIIPSLLYVIARRTPEWFSRADDEAIFFYYNRKEIEIPALAGLAPKKPSLRAATLGEAVSTLLT